MASEIRVDKINSLSGVGTVTLSPTGVDIAGITTAATLRATTGIVTSLTAVSSAKVGSGVTLSPDGDIFATGVTTSTTFVGALTGNVTGNISGGTVAGSTGTFSGDVSIADKIVHTGDTHTAMRFTGNDTITFDTGGTSRVQITDATTDIGNDVSIADKIIHTGDTNTAIRFPADDTISLETSGQDRLRIASDGLITQKTGDLIIDQTNNGYGGLRIVDSSAGEYSVSYILGRNSGLSAHIFKYNGRTQNSSPWSNNGTGIEMGRWTAAGIAFGGDTAAANSLDDYEEGTWTPTLTNTGTNASVNYSVQHGRYTKIGNVVHLFCFMDIAAGGITAAGTGDSTISGLPFATSNDPTNSDCHGSACDNIKSIPNSFSSQRNNAMLFFAHSSSVIALHQYSTTNPIYQTGWGSSQVANGDRFKWAWTAQYRTDS